MAVVQSIQRGSVTYTSGSGTAPTVSITTVVLAQSVLTFSMRCSDVLGRVKRHLFTGELAASLITFTRYESSFAESVTLDWEVIEFDSSVSVQRGTADLTANSTDISLTTVDDTTSFAIFSQRTIQNARLLDARALASITGSGAYLTFDFWTGFAPTSGECVVAWQVIEFDSSSASVQQVDVSLAAFTEFNKTATISSVDTGKTFIVGSSISPQSTDPEGRDIALIELQDSTTVKVTRTSAGTTLELDAHVFVVEMLDGTTVESGVASITSTNTTPTTQPSFTAMSNPSMMFGAPQPNGCPNGSSGANTLNNISASMSVDGTLDGITIQRNGNSYDMDYAWYVIDWNASAGSSFQAAWARGSNQILGGFNP